MNSLFLVGVIFSLVVSCHAQAIVSTPASTQTIKQPAATSLNLNVFNGIIYSNNFGTLQLAVASACNGTVPGSVILSTGTTTVTPFVTVPSNCTIMGQGVQSVIAGTINTTGSNILLKDFSVEGSLIGTSDCIDIGSSAKNIVLDGIIVGNCANQGILLNGTVSNVVIRNGEVYKAGRSIVGGQGTAGISLTGVSHVSILNERVHDSSGGIQISNSGVVDQDVSGISITDSVIYNNAFDAILVTISNPAGGNISGVRVENNEIYCNGWPLNGTGFSPNCTPGFLQNGPAASGSGVGVDVIQQQGLTILRPIITGNDIHDNTFEAVALSTNVNPTINTSGTSVTWVSGPKFNTQYVPGQWAIINGTGYQIASVPNDTAMKLQTPAGNQTNVATNMAAYMGAIVSNNYSYNNGGPMSGAGGTSVGPGFYNELSDGNAYSNNIAEGAWLDGYINFYSAFTSYNGDKAFSNGRGGVSANKSGFNNAGGFEVSYNGVTVGSHNNTSPVGFYIAQSQNTNIYSLSNHATTTLADAGSNTAYTTSMGTKPIPPFINSYGFQQAQSLSCVTASILHARCGTTITLLVPEPDINYMVQCSGYNASTNFIDLGVTSKTQNSFVWNIANLDSSGGGETLSCLITHL